MVSSPRPAAQIPQSKMNLWDERFSSGRPKVISDNPKRLDAARPPSAPAAAPESGLSENLHASTDYYWRPNSTVPCACPIIHTRVRRKFPTSAEDQSCVHAPDRNATNRGAAGRTSRLHSLRSPMHSHLKNIDAYRFGLSKGAKI
ncbi:hypothetical protein EVAR_99571_1 [Eumeta japonica]|uniref:Uncharacterized protein n=1 Tax=Eumeta variegata TaxID=151549 RepID=A0A4C1YY57_EUMVA|nr:hypothetical protein EVAR_99571_1 [Eumeta japonica]